LELATSVGRFVSSASSDGFQQQVDDAWLSLARIATAWSTDAIFTAPSFTCS
jgi:hypothetical protein